MLKTNPIWDKWTKPDKREKKNFLRKIIILKILSFQVLKGIWASNYLAFIIRMKELQLTLPHLIFSI